MAQPEKQPKSGKDEGIIQKKDSKGNLVWYARIVRIEPNGKKKQITKKGDNKTHAKELLKDLVNDFDERGFKGIEGNRMTFKKLSEDYKKKHLTQAQFHDSNGNRRKIAGLKNWKDPQRFLDTLANYFGNCLIRELTHLDIEKYKVDRLNTPVIHRKKIKTENGFEFDETEKPRQISGVNRELEQLRAVLRFAVRQGWLIRSPFELGKPLISKSDETRRERILSYDEEARLLAACDLTTSNYERKGKKIEAKNPIGVNDRRKTLKLLIQLAVDSSMRKGELLKLKWQDIDLNAEIIKIKASNTKTESARQVPMTPRVKEGLTKLLEEKSAGPGELVFGIEDTVKRSFGTACDNAGIKDFCFHDLRHTAITRMIAAGIPAQEVMKISGHTQMTTFLRYLNPSENSLKSSIERLASFNLGNQVTIELTSQALN